MILPEKFSKNGVLATLMWISIILFLLIVYRSYGIVDAALDISHLPLIESESKIIKFKSISKNTSARQNEFYSNLNKSNIDDTRINFAKNVGDVRAESSSKLILDRKIRYVAEESLLEDKRKEDYAVKNMETGGKKRIADALFEKYFSGFRSRAKAVEKNSGGNYRVQVVALKNRQQTANYVNSFRKSYSDLLKNLSIFIDELNLEEKGIFYRVQIGEFGTKSEAYGFCEAYLKRSSGAVTNCVLVR
ncbi:MAG: SPOR domain-containing protein [Rickettsiales bacterium]|jgi:hypothetical protein|nr:SPOR domain-containing protein [Rickettsiales bacterium]